MTGGRPHVEGTDAGSTLHGELIALPDAGAATVLLVLADDGADVALFAVDPSSPGVTVTPRRHVDPTRKMFDVGLDAVPARRLGVASNEALNGLADDVLIAAAADALGAARAVMDLAIDYAKVRRQFDAPIGSFQAVQHLCVDMYETVELARGGVIHALWAADGAEPDRTTPRGDARQGLRGPAGHRRRYRHSGLRRHRLHVGARRAPLPQAPARLELPCIGGSDQYLEAVGRRLVAEHVEGN